MDGDRRLIVNSGANRTTTTDPNFCFTSGLLSAADACLSRFPGLPGVDYNGAVVNRLLPNPLTPQHLMSPGASWSPAKPAQLPHHYRMDQNPQALLNHFGSTQAFLQTLWGTTTNGTNYNQRLPPSLKPPERDSLMINSPQFLGHGDGRPFFQQSSQVPLGNLPSTQRHTHLEPQYQHGQMIQQQQIQQKIMGDMNRTELPPNSPATANDRSVPQSNERSPLVRSANSHSSSTASPLTMRSSSGTPATLNQSNESLQQQQHNHQYQQQNYQSPQASMSSQESSPVLRTHSSMSNSNNTEAQESTKGGFSGHFQQQSNNGDRIMFSPGAQVNPQRSQQRLMQNFQPGNASSGFYPFKVR